MADTKKYKCSECTKEYESYIGMWRHKKEKHKNAPIIQPIQITDENKFKICKYCNKEFSNANHRWRHEKQNCKKNPAKINPNTNTTASTQPIQQTINNTVNNNIQAQNIIQTQNNTQNNVFNISFNKLGNEDLNILTQEEIEEIIDNGLNSIIKLIEFINFNKAHPQNHTFCTTNLNNNFASILNTDTNEIETKPKVDIYDKVLYYALRHIKELRHKIIDKKKRKTFKDKITEIEQNIFGGEAKYKKIVIDQLKSLSYTKRNMVEKTWDKYIKEYISLII